MTAMLTYSRGFLVNRLFHLWGEFCLHVIIASTLGGYRTLDGQHLSRGTHIASTADVLRAIKEQRLSGPGLRWGDPAWTANKLNQLGPANQSKISLGIGSAPYEDFRRVRNFVIHSNAHTRSQFDAVALKYLLVTISVNDLLFHGLPGGATVMEGWVRDFQDAALDVVR